MVFAQWNKRCWDLISEFEVAERQMDKGYCNNLVRTEWIAYYPSREALWIEESFEPFWAWCNEALAVCRWLAIYENSGTTSVKLLKDDDNDIDRLDRQALIEIGRPPR